MMQHEILSYILLVFPPRFSFFTLLPEPPASVNVVFAQCAILRCMCACCIKLHPNETGFIIRKRLEPSERCFSTS